MRGGSGEARRWAPQWARWAAVVSVVGASLLVLSACGGGNVRRAVNVTVNEQGQAGFAPLETTVQKGDRVNLLVVNHTDRVHGLTIRGYGVKPLQIGPDAPGDVRFTADRAGTYEIFCQLHPAHRKAAFVVE